IVGAGATGTERVVRIALDRPTVCDCLIVASEVRRATPGASACNTEGATHTDRDEQEPERAAHAIALASSVPGHRSRAKRDSAAFVVRPSTLRRPQRVDTC